jgi:hypothetical protein
MNPSPILLLCVPESVLDSMCSNENQNRNVIYVLLELVTPQGFFPKTLNPKPDPTFWMVVYSGNGFYIITSASFTSQAICYNHWLLSEMLWAKSYDYGVQVHSWQEDWHGTAPKRIENANILGANTTIDTDKVEDLRCPVCMWMQCQK